MKEIIKKLKEKSSIRYPFTERKVDMFWIEMAIEETKKQEKEKFLKLINNLQDKWRDDAEPVYEQLEELKKELSKKRKLEKPKQVEKVDVTKMDFYKKGQELLKKRKLEEKNE